MESNKTTETMPLGKGIEYSYISNADKHYFGGFLNLAQNNIEAVFKIFSQRFAINFSNSISIIKDQFKDNIASSEYQKKIEFLKQYFPVIHYLDLEITNKQFATLKDKENARREYFRVNFTLLIDAINELRNFYSHHYHDPITLKNDFFTLLDNLFVAVVFDVKKRKMKGDQTKHLLKKGLHDEIKKLIELKKTHLKEQEKEGKRVNLALEAIENAIFNDAFHHLLYKEGVNKNYQSKSEIKSEIENNLNISESGLLFLLSIFLQRKENEQLRANIKGYKAKIIIDEAKPIDRNNNSLKYMATHWVFNYLSVKTIKQRLNTTFHKETLLIQIADELSKVPDALYQTFTQQQKDEFVEDINEYLKENNQPESLEKSTVIHPIIRKRYEDKFNYFALRFLDEFVDFPSLRFQIHLGNYVQDRREKVISGTRYKTERVIKEKINVFGKLSQLSQIKSDFFNSLEKETQWEMFPNPSYNFIGNNIPIYIDLKKSNIEGAGRLNGLLTQLNKKQETEERKENKPSKKKIITEINEDVVFGKPTALFSLNEMQALLYEILVNNKTGKEIEEILIQQLINRYETIYNFSPEKTMPTSQITKKLRKSTNETQIDYDKLLRAIINELNITKEKLCLIKNNEQELKNNKRKFVFTNKELGQQATWLANDIKRFMPKETKENWKGYQHSQLQQFLAFYEANREEVFSFLKSYWNFESETYLFNNWLKTAFTEKIFYNCYYKYLSFREQYFENLKNQKFLKKFIKQEYVWSVFYKRLYEISSTETQKDQLLLKPLVFTRGIFDEKPTYIKNKNIDNEAHLFANWYQYIQDKKHKFQHFYSLERDYKDLYEKHNNTTEFTANKYNLSNTEKLELFKRKWDKKLKKIKGQDLFLNLMLKKIIHKMYNHEVDLELSDFYLTKKQRIEIQNKAIKQSQREKEDKSENIIKDDFIWNMTIPFKSGKINEPAIKLKDIGKFTRFLQDEKVERILGYNPNKTWTKLEIEKELDAYERIRREEVFKTFQEFEKEILKKFNFNGTNHPKEFTDDKGNPNFRKYITQGVLKDDPSIKKEDVEWIKDFEGDETVKQFNEKPEKIQKAFLLIYVRNKFAHNQLPITAHYNVMVSNTENTNLVAENILNYIKNVIYNDLEIKKQTL